MSRKRKYAIPYNGYNPDWFVDEVVKRKEYIDHVFCELPYGDLLSHIRFKFDNVADNVISAESNMQLQSVYVQNCIKFLRLSKGKFKRICPINAMYYKFDELSDLIEFSLKLLQLVCEFEIDGLIITDYRIGLILHQLMPDLELHTSCNCYQWNVRQMEIWREKVGIKTFNPPREILRKPSVLKEMHDAGFRLKCLVNESCLMGCPNSFNHQMSISLSCFSGSLCFQNGVGDIFRGNYILPRWQKFYDKYVDVYKIAGRNVGGIYPIDALDAYIKEDNLMSLFSLMISGPLSIAKKILPIDIQKKITLDKVPDKLLNCECKDCVKCGLCEKILKKFIPSEYCSKFDKQQSYISFENIEEIRKNGFKNVVFNFVK